MNNVTSTEMAIVVIIALLLGCIAWYFIDDREFF